MTHSKRWKCILVGIALSANACRSQKAPEISNPRQVNQQPTPEQQQAPGQEQQAPAVEPTDPGLCDGKVAKGSSCRSATNPVLTGQGYKWDVSACITSTNNGRQIAVYPMGGVDACPPSVACAATPDRSSSHEIKIGGGPAVPMGSPEECDKNKKKLEYDFAHLKP
ncbi:MAG: hypothetical protein AB7T49_06365 [Oligoflexales bacterium]